MYNRWETAHKICTWKSTKPWGKRDWVVKAEKKCTAVQTLSKVFCFFCYDNSWGKPGWNWMGQRVEQRYQNQRENCETLIYRKKRWTLPCLSYCVHQAPSLPLLRQKVKHWSTLKTTYYMSTWPPRALASTHTDMGDIGERETFSLANLTCEYSS